MARQKVYLEIIFQIRAWNGVALSVGPDPIKKYLGS